jgi:hypothetical protein
MKHITLFSYIFFAISMLCLTTQADQYSYPQAYITLNSQYTTTSNICFSAQARLATHKNHYTTSFTPTQQLAIIHHWIESYYPKNSYSYIQQKIIPSKAQSIAPKLRKTPEPEGTAPEATPPHYDATYITQLEDQLFVQQQSAEWDAHVDILNTRNNAIAEIKNGNKKIVTQHHNISSKIDRYCKHNKIETAALEQCTGTILQQTIHNEFIAITKHSAHVWHNNRSPKALKKTTKILADFTDAGVKFNHAQETRKALVLADTCWMILDCIQAAGEGLLEGAYHTVDDIVHPVRTAQNIAESAAICGYYIGKVAIEIGQLGYLALADHPKYVHEKLTVWADNFELVYHAIKEKCSTLKTREVVKETVSFGMQCYATHKALHGIGKLFKHGHKYAKALENNIPAIAKTNALTTPEGVIIRIADSTMECIKRELPPATTTKPLQVANMSEFFKHPFGEMLLKKSQKTPYRYQNPIYKLTENIPGTTLKKNHFYYLDRLHGNHLEVFDQTYQCIGVYNLDGTFNQIKYDLARKNGRIIRNLIKGK